MFRKTFFLLLVVFLSFLTSPSLAQQLRDVRVSGYLRLGDTVDATVANLRYHNGHFEGYSGSGWAQLDGYFGHGSLIDLTSSDAHTQYALLVGRSGGQTLYGSSLASENLTLNATSNATPGKVIVNSIVNGTVHINPNFGYLNIGPYSDLSSPSFLFINRDGGLSSPLIRSYVASSQGNAIVSQRARGSLASPSSSLSGDVIFSFGGEGYNGSAWTGDNSAVEQFVASGDFGLKQYPTKICMATTAPGATTRSINWSLSDWGRVGIGSDQQSISTFYVRSQVVFDFVYYYNGSTFTSRSAESKTTFGTPFIILSDNDDYLYVSGIATTNGQFTTVYFDLATIGAGVTLVKEYWNGSIWTALSVTDGTSNLTQSGAITFTAPTNWELTTVNTYNRYWVRFSTTSNPGVSPTCNYMLAENVPRLYILANYADDTPSLKVGHNAQVSLYYGTGINEFSTDGTLGGNSDLALPTEKAVKTYVDSSTGSQYLLANGTRPLTGAWNAGNYVITAGGFSLRSAEVTLANITSPADGQFTFAPQSANIDTTFNFTGTTYSGILKWMEDENAFVFEDQVLIGISAWAPPAISLVVSDPFAFGVAVHDTIGIRAGLSGGNNTLPSSLGGITWLQTADPTKDPRIQYVIDNPGSFSYGHLEFWARLGTGLSQEVFRVGGTGVVTFTPPADTDLTFNFMGTTNSGLLKWMEDENAFYFANNMGIGTTTPTQYARLHVKSDDHTLIVCEAPTGYTAQFELMKAGAKVWSMLSPANSTDLQFDNTAVRATITAAGNMGIGTTTPIQYARLHVKSDDHTVIVCEAPTGYTAGYQLFKSGVKAWSIETQANSTDLRFFNTEDRVTITAAGNMGIGTTTPIANARLHVKSDIDTVIACEAPTGYTTQFELRKAGDKVWSVYIPANSTNLQFYSGVTTAVRATITAAGNMGIGTTTPNSPLDVVGTTQTDILRIDDAAGTTYMSSGTGTIKMANTRNADNSIWIRININGSDYYFPAWTTAWPPP